MPTARVMTAGFNIVVLALTPVERWKAAGQFSAGLMTERLFILTGVAAIIILTALLLIVTYSRIAHERKISEQLFFNNADKRGLSERERRILLEIAQKAGLKRSESIFTMLSAFDHGAGKMTEESLAQQGAEESKWLRSELSFLREKLGFQKKPSISIGLPTKSNKPSSRQIPIGKKIYITCRETDGLADIESTIIHNNDMELIVKSSKSLESKLGEICSVHYYFGTSVWEFDTSVVNCNGEVLVLNHSDNVRFINRRRFLRVPVKKPAFIARFPFSRTQQPDSSKMEPGMKQSSVKTFRDNWGPPEFMPATVTELGGPGLRIETQLEVKVGDRVVVILKLSEETDRDLIPSATSTSLDPVLVQDRKTIPAKIVEDIGQVRHIRAVQDGFSIAVELTGLSDPDLSELIRTTNTASIRNNDNRQETLDSINTEEQLSEPVVLQGV